MRKTMVVLLVGIACATGGALLRAQAEPTTNPLAGNAAAIQAGQGIFRSRCADCHGMDARGVRGPDLTEVWSSGRTDGGLFRTLRRGVSGTSPSVTPKSLSAFSTACTMTAGAAMRPPSPPPLMPYSV